MKIRGQRKSSSRNEGKSTVSKIIQKDQLLKQEGSLGLTSVPYSTLHWSAAVFSKLMD
jgi:hypothetical protein